MMPVECPSMRSIARWVLPVLVGPSTAVTPAPRARASRLVGDENEMGIDVLNSNGEVCALSVFASDRLFLPCQRLHVRNASLFTLVSPRLRPRRVVDRRYLNALTSDSAKHFCKAT